MAFFNEFPHTRNYDSDLGWLIESVRKLIGCCDQMTAWKEEHEQEYQELKQLYDDIATGNFPEALEAGFTKWIKDNAYDLIGEMVKMVFFGLTDTGYFVAYIPDSWDDIIFNTTGHDITVAGVGYGHLTLSY